MIKSEINFTVELDDNRLPEKISWNASDKSETDQTDTNAVSISVWDQANKDTLRIDLWTKEMSVFEMKRFHIESLGIMAQKILEATGDEFMANEMNDLCEKLVAYLKKENNMQ